MEGAGLVNGLTINDTEEIVCEKCQNNTFISVMYLRRLSPLRSPDGQEHVIPINSLACSACGHVNENMKPQSDIQLQ